MSKIFRTVTILLLLGLLVGIVEGAATLSIDHPEFARAGPGQWQNFTVTVCGMAGPYQLTISPGPENWNAKLPWPDLVISSVKYTMDPSASYVYYIPAPGGSCDTFEFNTWEGTTPANYWILLSAKDGNYYTRTAQANVTVLDPEAVRAAQETARNDAKVAALEAKVTAQEKQIAVLQNATPTPTGTASPVVATPTQNTSVKTFGQLSGVTPAPTYTPHATPTVDYDAKIAALNAQLNETRQKQAEQDDLIHQILAFLGIK